MFICNGSGTSFPTLNLYVSLYLTSFPLPSLMLFNIQYRSSFDFSTYVPARIIDTHTGVPTYSVALADATGLKVFISLLNPDSDLESPDILSINTIVSRYGLKFFVHCVTVAFEPSTRIRPGVRSGYDLYIGVADDTTPTNPTPQGCHIESLALAMQISSNTQLTVFLAMRYTDGAKTDICDAGLIAIPTRNIFTPHSVFTDSHDDDYTLYTPLYSCLRKSIPPSAHRAAQLTFAPDRFPATTAAELIPGLNDCAVWEYVQIWIEMHHRRSDRFDDSSSGCVNAQSAESSNRSDVLDEHALLANRLVGFVDEVDLEPVTILKYLL